MKYFSVEQVADSYKRLQQCTDEKFWGIMSILVGLPSSVVSNVCYPVQCSKISSFLENLFRFGNKKSYNGDDVLYVMFSSFWKKSVLDFFLKRKPFLYDLLVWSHRNIALPDECDNSMLVSLFIEKFHLSLSDLSYFVEDDVIEFSYSENLYNESDFLSRIGINTLNVNKTLKMNGTLVEANPGELSRGPFVQPLYAALSTINCLLISPVDLSVFYNYKSCSNHMVNIDAPSPSQSDIISAHQSLLLALRTKPFVLLAGISGTGKSRIVRELAFASCPERLQDEDGTTPGNYCMVEVKPNWHDSTELLGYYSSVSKKYYLTKFIHFLYKASLDENKNVPFFVCLDEMNLAPVEQYFAEFLSVLETRKFANNHIVTEQLIKKEEFEKCELPEEGDTIGNTRVQLLSDIKYSDNELEIIKYLKENGLVLPENVFVIGTVNMDDTTHQFSRKVIDRAMTIEMNGGNLMDMFGGSKKLAYVPDPLPLGAFLPKYVTADEVIEAHGNCEVQMKNITVELLDALNNTLKNTPFQISYRVLNELVIYLGNVLDDKGYDGDGTDDTFVDYVSESFANIVMMKVLPRIEGDQELLEGKLEGIQAMTRNEKLNAKLQDMIDRLEDQSFTRFWA